MANLEDGASMLMTLARWDAKRRPKPSGYRSDGDMYVESNGGRAGRQDADDAKMTAADEKTGAADGPGSRREER
jgi:hypothetical protein